MDTDTNFLEGIRQKVICDLEVEIEKYLTEHFENVIVPRIRNEVISRAVVNLWQNTNTNSLELSITLRPKV